MLAALALIAVCVVLYAGVLPAPFVLDDLPSIRDNAWIRWRELSLANLAAAVRGSPLPRPVAYLSFGLDYWLGGYDPARYRATNVAIHAVNALLVYALALATWRRAAALRAGPPRLAGPRAAGGAALLVALLFAAHPLQIQSVTYLVQRMNALAAGFCLAALLLTLRGLECARAPLRRACWGGALLAWGLALGSKPNAVVMPFAVWLYVWYFERDLDRGFLRRSLPWLGAGLGALGLLLVFATDGFRDFAAQDFGMGERLLTQLRVLWIYLGLVLLPLPGRLDLLHEVAPSSSLLAPISTLLGGLGLLALITAAALLARRWRVVSFGIAWFLLQLALESSVLPLAMLYEHRLYLPLVGAALAFVALAFRALPVPAAAGLGVAVAVALGAATLERNRVWLDPVDLWADTVAKSPQSWRARDEYGRALALAGRPDEALLEYREALRLGPAHPEPWLHVGAALAQRGESAEGTRLLQEALRLDPDFARAHHVLGLLLLEQGRSDAGLAHLERAAELAPGDAPMQTSLGVALAAAGREREARAVLERALELDPSSLHARNNLAWILATSADPTLRDPARAVALAEAAAEDAGADDPGVLDTLAAAYAAAGRFEEAAALAERAAALAESEGDADTAAAIRRRASLYAGGRGLPQPE